jgi:hypothetical protein
MTVECYNSVCKYHSCHTMMDEGPFCYEAECLLDADSFVIELPATQSMMLRNPVTPEQDIPMSDHNE